MNNNESIGSDSVIRLADDKHQVGLGSTFSGKDALQKPSAVSSQMNRNSELTEAWLSEGVPCEVMHPGQKWRKGTVKIMMIFTPGETQELETTPL